MKPIFRAFRLLFLLSIFSISLLAQSTDCESVDNKYRTAKNQWIIKKVNEPFNQTEITDFHGLYYHGIDCNYVFKGAISLTEPGKKVDVAMHDGSTVQLYHYGIISCIIDGVKYNLTAYKNINMPEFAENPGTVFIPILDGSSGPDPGQTYENGRYLIIHPPTSGKQVELDFNMATNPYADYNNKYSSLVVSQSNTIMAPIETGERKYEDR